VDTHPSANPEDLHVARHEFELRAKAEEAKRAKLEAEERNRLGELHHMCCPKCGSKLLTVDYKGIAIDECSHCKGVWLDHSELEQILRLERTTLDKFVRLFK
jgi:ribosomal protein L37AE/L43A